MALHHAPLLHELYQVTPGYFELLGSRAPQLSDVQRDLEIALLDPRRHLELIHLVSGQLVGYLDYKVSYPQPTDLTINLLLIRQDCQNQQLGRQVIRHLERHLPAGTQRILASVLGENPRGVHFWERQGYSFELDARPAMTWYAKRVGFEAKPQKTGMGAAAS